MTYLKKLYLQHVQTAGCLLSRDFLKKNKLPAPGRLDGRGFSVVTAISVISFFTYMHSTEQYMCNFLFYFLIEEKKTFQFLKFEVFVRNSHTFFYFTLNKAK